MISIAVPPGSRAPPLGALDFDADLMPGVRQGPCRGRAAFQ